MTQSQPIDNIKNHQLYYQQDLRVPMTNITLTFHGGGSGQEPLHLYGLAHITAKMLFRGTPTMTREEISKKFELLGAAIEAHDSETDFFILISCFTKNLDTVLRLLAGILDTANFPQHELDILKKQELNGMEADLQDPEEVLSAAHEYVLFGMDSLGKLGSRQAINRITREDIKKFYESVRATQVLYLTAISDLPKEKLEEQLSLLIHNRPTNGFMLKPEARYHNASGYEAIIVNSSEATNDRLMWSHRGIGATDERRFDLSLVIDALGSFEGFLFDQLRNKNGWCYGAYAFAMQATTRPGRIAYYADPTSETSTMLIPEMLRLLHLFPDEKDFQERFAERNTTFKNRYAYQLDLKKKLSNEINRDRYGIPILDKEQYYQQIDAVTLSTAKKTIGEVFDPKNMTMVFYGDAARLKTILAKLDPSVNITLLEKDILIQ